MMALSGLVPRALPKAVRLALFVGLGGAVLAMGYFGLVAPTPENLWLIDPHDGSPHVAAFFVLTLVGAMLFTLARRVGMMAFAAGLILELIQLPTAHHHFSVGDVLANAVGVVLGLMAFAAISRAWTRLTGAAFPGPVESTGA